MQDQSYYPLGQLVSLAGRALLMTGTLFGG